MAFRLVVPGPTTEMLLGEAIANAKRIITPPK
jgi:hypothetical protein